MYFVLLYCLIYLQCNYITGHSAHSTQVVRTEYDAIDLTPSPPIPPPLYPPPPSIPPCGLLFVFEVERPRTYDVCESMCVCLCLEEGGVSVCVNDRYGAGGTSVCLKSFLRKRC